MSVAPAERAPRGVELNGINVIAEDERQGTPRALFWPWFASNISVLGVAYGAFILGFGISFWQAVLAGGPGGGASFWGWGALAPGGQRGAVPPRGSSRGGGAGGGD